MVLDGNAPACASAVSKALHVGIWGAGKEAVELRC